MSLAAYGIRVRCPLPDNANVLAGGRRVPRIPALILIGALLPAIAACREQAPAATPAGESTLTEVGQTAPTIVLTTLDGGAFNLADLRGRVVAINFFATWCGPCRAEIPHLERELWARFKDRGLAMIGIGRQHTIAELEPFVREVGITYPVAGDPDRRAFGLYATQAIPRNVVVGKDGTIVYQSIGYSPDEFKRMLDAVELALAG